MSCTTRELPRASERRSRPIVPIAGIAYQPLIALRSGELVGAEALSRFAAPTSTAAQLVAIERTGHSGTFDLQVLRRVLVALEHDAGHIPVHVNVSARSLHDPWFAGDLRELLLTRPAAARRVVLELTETAPLPGRRAVLGFAVAAREAGARIAVDDAPAGHDRHLAICLLAPEVVKLDGPTLRRAAHDGVERIRLQAIVTLARDHGAELVAEGIEDEGQIEAALCFGAHVGQGFLLGAPQRCRLDELVPFQKADGRSDVRQAGRSATS